METKRHIVVELIQHELVNDLEKRINQLDGDLLDLKRRYSELEVKYGYECYLNNELCDLCRSAGVSFRPALERARRKK